MEIKNGDIILVHSHNVSALLIQFGMNVKRWLNPIFWYKYFKKQTNEKIWKTVFNHAGMGRGYNLIQEAIDEGVKTRDINTAYGKKKNLTIRVYRYNWSDSQLNNIEIIANKLENTKYQFDNFLIWPVNILTFGLIWLGRSSNKAFNKIYCTELDGSKIYYATAPNLSKSKLDDLVHYKFRNYWKTSPNKIQDFCENHCEFISEYKL